MAGARVAAVVFLLAAASAGLWPSQLQALTAAQYSDEALLEDLLWNHAPEVLEARTSSGIAASEVTRAQKYPNPAVDFTWGTIPLGTSNPPDLHEPLDHVPNYTIGISELVELAKRGPRQAATAAELERSRAQTLAVLATRFFDLLEAIGRIAKTQQRAAVTDQLVNASAELLDLDRARASKGDIAVVDLDRTEVEHERLLSTRDAALTELDAARAECTAILTLPCESFDSGKAARAFLEHAATAPLPSSWSVDLERGRPDIAALDAALRAADARAILARRHAIPDVTLRVGYTYDTFTIAGNQRNSLSLGLQMPIPLLDQGQADLQAAMATVEHALQAREALANAGRVVMESAARRRDLITARMHRLDGALAKARHVRDILVAVQRRGGTSLTDVLLARRNYEELLLDRSDLDADAFEATLQLRQAAALFPHPNELLQVGIR